MYLSLLIKPWFQIESVIEIKRLSIDSRKTQRGDLFFCLPGHSVDGRLFIDDALNKGVHAVLVHTSDIKQHGQLVNDNNQVFFFYDLINCMHAIINRFYKLEELPVNIVGVTGTNGKTSVTHFIAQIGELLHQKTAVLGTVGNGFLPNLQETSNTTSDAITIAEALVELNHQGATTFALEVSSHGLVQQRVNAVGFDLAVFTNISRDHIDYHNSMHNYIRAKSRLFAANLSKAALFNIDDPCGEEFFNNCNLKKYSYSLCNQEADYYLTDIVSGGFGFTANLFVQTEAFSIEFNTLARFNLYNIIAAIATWHILGMDLAKIVSCVPSLQAISGRMNFIKHKGVCYVVDYAHTPDSLSQVLQALREQTQNKLWCVFGCGGDRDVGKRPIMANIAQTEADNIIITSDNPRNESLELIFSDIRNGLMHLDQVTFEQDRKSAIRQAIDLSSAGDVVLVAGKGHESYQEIQGVKHYHNDYDFIQFYLRGKA